MSLINKLGDYNSKIDRSKVEKTFEPSFIPNTEVAKLDL